MCSNIENTKDLKILVPFNYDKSEPFALKHLGGTLLLSPVIIRERSEENCSQKEKKQKLRFFPLSNNKVRNMLK